MLKVLYYRMVLSSATMPHPWKYRTAFVFLLVGRQIQTQSFWLFLPFRVSKLNLSDYFSSVCACPERFQGHAGNRDCSHLELCLAKTKYTSRNLVARICRYPLFVIFQLCDGGLEANFIHLSKAKQVRKLSLTCTHSSSPPCMESAFETSRSRAEMRLSKLLSLKICRY